MTEPAATKMLLIDDDQAFGQIMKAVAENRGIEPHYFTSLLELGSFARIKEFDIALLDYYLDSLNGNEIAEYVDTFFQETPVVMVSARTFDEEEKSRWPSCVRHFVTKDLGAERILDEALQVLERDRFLKHHQQDKKGNSSNPPAL